MKIQQLILQGLQSNTNAISYYVSQELAGLYPKKYLIEGKDYAFNVEGYAVEGLCEIEYESSIYNQLLTGWDGTDNKLYNYIENACFEVRWQGHQLDVLTMSWLGGHCKEKYYWLLADNKEVAEKFFADVCLWYSEIRDEILVFEDGFWSKNQELYESIQNASFDNLILGGTLKQDIQADLTNFFSAKGTYESYGIPWKRGILFIGAPGNGKTHTVKALINKMQVPCLYVKSLRAQYDNPHHNIKTVFDRARESAPCLLILEDLDSLVDDGNRSFFLNEIDGFAANTGIVILATTNHPEKIDPAILNRPSRFDRKYYFELPAIAERVTYINLWNSKLKSVMRLEDGEACSLAEITDGFSFAYLKELFLSSMMHWMRTMETGGMLNTMIAQVAVLREQMVESVEESKNSQLPN
ncbi:AAA family ATPase [Brunnivagina elsteri]|uniref:ATPase n=1 Tax=Brunnivagina elsteri CCALA 953 TaxID=987040 RepID=A0A2A2TJC8_9CYAN|nr:ATP-binding protein [Calothrix elsteri]PAX54885.1 ATPase [Calothrix elsteri CCALA 953]